MFCFLLLLLLLLLLSGCSAIAKKHGAATNGLYILLKGKEVFTAQCKVVGKAFVSLGGDGKTQARAIAKDCKGNSLAASNADKFKFVIKADNAEDTSKAAKIDCNPVPDGSES